MNSNFTNNDQILEKTSSSANCRETTLHGGLVMAKSGRLELRDCILRTL